MTSTLAPRQTHATPATPKSTWSASADLAARYLAARARSLIAWALGILGFTLLIVAIYPTVRDSENFSAAVEDYPDAIKEFLGGEAAFDLASGPGFLNAEMYSLMLPLLLAFVAVGIGASLGGDQESGLMDVVLANPISRAGVVMAKTITLIVSVVGLAAIVGVSVLAFDPVVDLGIGVSNVMAATVATSLLVIFHGLVAAAVGALTGRRSAAIGVAVTVFAAGYILNGLGGLVSWLEPLRPISPYHHAVGGNPLLEGWNATGFAVLAAMSVATFAATIVAFERRDIT
ncbi:MAG: ABC transporter permease subunit [Acidimicrobiales bacterium]